MFKDVSFLIATKRNYENYAKRFIDSLYEIRTNYSFEIIICSPEKISDNRVIWIEDDKKCGASYAYNLAAQKSSGKFLFICVDDALILGDIFGAIDFLKSDLFKNREYKITTLAGGITDELTRPEPSPRHPKYLNLTNNYTNYPNDCIVMCFPIMSRDTFINKFDQNIWHPRVKICHDWWLGAFLAMNGEPGIQYNGAKFLIAKSNSDEFVYDQIIERHTPKYFGESYVNTYRLMKNYKKGLPYVYDKEEEYLTEEKILSMEKSENG